MRKKQEESLNELHDDDDDNDKSSSGGDSNAGSCTESSGKDTGIDWGMGMCCCIPLFLLSFYHIIFRKHFHQFKKNCSHKCQILCFIY